MHIAGSQELLKQHGYSLKRTGPIEYSITDDENDDEVVAVGKTPAEAVRIILAERFECQS